MKIDDQKKSCRLGQGHECCIYLTCGANGFQCEKGTDSKIERTLNKNLEAGTTNAKGTGDWEECLHNHISEGILETSAIPYKDSKVMKILKDGEPCHHTGCLNHVTHPCEGCGRIAGRGSIIGAKIVESVLDGTLCIICGEIVYDGDLKTAPEHEVSPGYPRSCIECKECED